MTLSCHVLFFFISCNVFRLHTATISAESNLCSGPTGPWQINCNVWHTCGINVFQRMLYFLMYSREYFISSCVPENTLFPHVFQRTHKIQNLTQKKPFEFCGYEAPYWVLYNLHDSKIYLNCVSENTANSCNNGGTFIKEWQSCACPPGYGGLFCETSEHSF